MSDIPVKCEICGVNSAKIVVLRRKNRISVKQIVCKECAKGAVEKIAPSMVEPKRLLDQIVNYVPASTDSSFMCSVCGTQLAEIISDAKPGCCACYARFADALKGIIESIQPGSYHVGKTIPR